MPASITLSSLGFTLPDARVLFSDLNASFGREHIGIVGRNGAGKSTLLKLIAGELQPAAGRIRITGTVAMLSQGLGTQPGETLADLFGMRAALACLARIEAGAASAADLAEADWTLEARLAGALHEAGLGAAGPATPLACLSGGQRTRAALAALIFHQPGFLLLDEPTNNLDPAGREAVARLLAGWRGGAIVASHDRALLEGMDTIMELTSLGAAQYGGGWSAYEARKAAELEAAQQDLAAAQRRIGEVAGRSRLATERKARRDSAGRRKAARGGAPKISLGLHKRRAEASSGALSRLAEKHKAEAEAVADAARQKIEVIQPLTVRLAPTGLAGAKLVLAAENLTAGYDGAPPVIRNLSFEVRGPERAAICGASGSGKSTLLKVITGQLEPGAGTVRVHVPWVMLDQDVSLLDPRVTILENFRKINPETDENTCRAALARFRFRADAALQPAQALSGGEKLRAGLAVVLGAASPPQLLILDEPTNHLDISSLEAVEAGLCAYDGALIIVSHDEAFLGCAGVGRRMELVSRG